jgi:hypothetical protein
MISNSTFKLKSVTTHSKICCCSEGNNWRNCQLVGYRIPHNTSIWYYGTKHQRYSEKWSWCITLPAEFITIGELELSSSGKTVKLYIYQKGKRCFIGQVQRKSLAELAEGNSVKAGIYKYQNTCCWGTDI